MSSNSNIGDVSQKTGLDLSFIDTSEKSTDELITQAEQKNNGIDLSFLKPVLEGGGGSDEYGKTKVYDIGQLPEFSMPFEFKTRQAKTALGLTTTFNDEREVRLLKENYPELDIKQTQHGDYIIDGRAYGGNIGYLNKPGPSVRDALDLGIQIPAFTPAGRIGQMGTSASARVFGTGLGMGATQAGLDVTNQATGGTANISLGNIDKSDVGVAVGSGMFFQWLEPVFRMIGRTAARKHKDIRQALPAAKERFKRVLSDAGKDPDMATDEFVESYIIASEEATTQRAVSGLADEAEFGIKYTKGQATGDKKALELEDTMRGGGAGPEAQTIVQGFEQNVQKPSIVKATEGTQSNLTGSGHLMEIPAEAGQAVKGRIQAEATNLDNAIDTAYENVGESFLSVDGVNGLMRAVKNRARTIEFDKNLKQTSSVLNEIKEFEKILKGSGGVRAKPLHIQTLEQMRRRLATKISAAENQADRAQVTQLKAAFDEFMDKAVDGALFSGDETALESLKAARSLRAEYSSKFTQQNTRNKRGGREFKDPVGDIIERIVVTDPTDEQVINYLFGITKLGGKSAGAKLANRLKGMLGESSSEWNMVREAGFLKLRGNLKDDVVSGRQFANRINDALTNDPTLMKTLYTSEEIATMKRLSSAIIRAQPNPRNPPNTANKIAAIARESMIKLVQLLGMSKGVGPGVSATVAAQSGKALSNKKGAIAAKSSVRGADRRPLGRLNTSPLAPLGVSANENTNMEEIKENIFEYVP